MTPVSLPPDGENPYPADTYNAPNHAAYKRGYEAGFAAGRAAATPDGPEPCEKCRAWSSHCPRCAAASPDERLREALTDALEGMLDMRPYVPNYFAEKWDHDGYIERARAALEWRPLAAADREKPDAGSDGEDR